MGGNREVNKESREGGRERQRKGSEGTGNERTREGVRERQRKGSEGTAMLCNILYSECNVKRLKY